MYTVAIIGHRPNRLIAGFFLSIRKELGYVVNLARNVGELDEIGVLLKNQTPLPIAILTSLAEGSDRLGASIACENQQALHVVLPLPRAEYENDFADEASRGDFRAKLGTASRIIELGPVTGGQHSRDRAYQMSAEILLDHADMLVAVWDGAPPAGRGGTAMTIDDACARGMPVVIIDAKGVEPPKLVWHALKEGSLPAADPNMLPSAKAEDKLAEVVKRITAPPPGKQTEHLREFLRQTAIPPEEAPDLAKAQAAADCLANTYAGNFRRAVVLNFAAAFGAIAFAVVSLVQWKTIAPGWKLALLGLEFVLLMFIIVNTLVGRKGEWHRRWIEYREIAEHLRVAAILRDVGARAYDNKGEETRWVSWYVRDQLRKAGMPSLQLDAEGLAAAKARLSALAREQGDYHASAAEKAKRAEWWTEGVGSSAFVAAFVVAIGAIVITFLGVKSPDWLKMAAGSAAIILPALGSALLGIRLLADYAGVEERSHHAAHVFKDIARHLETDSLDLRHLRARANEIAEISLGDVVTWRVSAQSRKLDWPG